jgi:hypothetical protein
MPPRLLEVTVMAEKEASARPRIGRVKDARGRKVTQVDPVAMHLMHSPGIIPQDTLADLAQDIGFGTTKGVRIAFWGWIAILVCFVIALAILLTRLTNGAITTRKFIVSLVPYCGIWTGFFAFWNGARNNRHKRIGSIMLKHLRCPHCGYDIRGLPVDPQDGATVCPECGCAWKLDDVRSVREHGDG